MSCHEKNEDGGEGEKLKIEENISPIEVVKQHKYCMQNYISEFSIYICSAQSRNRYNSRIVLRKVGILTLLRKVGILTLRKTILELVLRKVGIGTKWE